MPHDIAVCEVGLSERKLENPDQLLPSGGDEAQSTRPTTQLFPLREAATSAAAPGCTNKSSKSVWNVRPLSRARSLWLVAYLTAEADEGAVVVRIGSIEWQAVPVTIERLETRERFEAVLTSVGWR